MTSVDLAHIRTPDSRARLDCAEEYVRRAVEAVPPGTDVTLTGSAPVWLYLKIAHALHGRVRALAYDSPVTGPVMIFNHDPR